MIDQSIINKYYLFMLLLLLLLFIFTITLINNIIIYYYLNFRKIVHEFNADRMMDLVLVRLEIKIQIIRSFIIM